MKTALALALAATLLGDVPRADACGCLSPPAVTEGDYAINQQAEQIIFEAEPGWVTAHVLIRYAGDPAQFAWLIPVPEVPELSLSPISAFAMLDNLTAPDVGVDQVDICPTSEWTCNYHAPLSCPGTYDDSPGFGALEDASVGYGDAAPNGAPPVTVISQQTVGDYQTVTFRASEASAAVQWLHDNGFIVNPTTSIYMESYIAANMVFVAAKLVPGAGVSAIKPLKMRYRAANPTVPLILTAVAAEPNLTVETFVYSNTPFKPLGHPVVTIDPARIAYDQLGRINYPEVLTRTIDEAGGDGFAIEYRGTPVTSSYGMSYCCSAGDDVCGIGGDGQCECPGTEFDSADCAATGDINDGVALLQALATKYTALTRITTRVSPEEMTWDPAFEADEAAPLDGKLVLRGSMPSLQRCIPSVIDQAKYQQITTAQTCATTYCGPHGQCVITASGAGCACDADSVAQQYTELDTQPSVTCVPKTPTVDLRAGGLVLPDACAGVSCGAGTCIDRNGVAVCQCTAGNGAVTSYSSSAPTCTAITTPSGGPGAQDYSEPLRGLAVCAPKPPVCGPDGWLVKTGSVRPGVDCGDTQPAPELTREPPAPSCPGVFGCSGCDVPGTAPIGALGGAWLVALLVFRRRRA